MKKVKVDKGLCIACGACVSSCDSCFEFGDDGKAQAKDSCKEECCDLQSVADDCPVQAISVAD